MAFNNYLEDENDKPYFKMNSLAYYYDKMEGFAKAVEGSAKALNLTKEEIEQRIALRLAEWDKNLESFDGSVEKLLTEWVDDGTLTHVIDSTLIEQRLAPVTAQLAETIEEVKRKREIEDLSPAVLAAIEGGEGTEFNLLSIPQNDSVSPEKLTSDMWLGIDRTIAKKGIEANPTENNFIFGADGSKSIEEVRYNNSPNFSQAVLTSVISDGDGFKIEPGGSYFYDVLINGSVSLKGFVSLALQATGDHSGFTKTMRFRDAEGATIGNEIPFLNIGKGWYFLEGVAIPQNSHRIQLRLDYRFNTGTNPVRFRFPTLQNAVKIKDDIYAEKNSLFSLESRTSQLEQQLSASKLKRKIVVATPADFGWKDHPLVGKIYTDGEGSFEVLGFDVSEYEPQGKAYYVDSQNGVDTQDGLTPATAFKGMKKAYDQPDCVQILLAEGVYDRNNGMWSKTITKNLSIKALPGHKVIINQHSPTAFTKLAGYSNVYSGSRGTLTKILDAKFKDTDGDIRELTLVSSIQAVNDTAGSYFQSGGVLYVRTMDNRAPDADLWLFAGGNSLYMEGGSTLYLENIDVYEGDSPLKVANTSAGLRPKVFAKGCNFFYSTNINSDTVMLQGTELSIFQKCSANKGKKDGFNYHWRNGIIPKAIEIDCVGRDNGNIEDGNDQGSTMHDGGTIIRINGSYYRNSGANIGDEASTNGDTQSWNLGCLAFESKAAAEFGNQNSNYFAYPYVKMWLDGCVGYGSAFNIVKSNYVDMFVRNPAFSGKLMPDEQTEPSYY